jgi:small conductance mechanosensitive channel
MIEERDQVLAALSSVSRRARTAEEGLKKAQEQVEALESPFSSHNILTWLRIHGPAILATLVVMSLLYWIVSRYSNRIVRLFAARGLRGSKAERDNRMETLVSVLQNTGSVVILIGGAMTIFSQAGVPVTPLLGGAAVAGVAVAFGAQNLIKDFFYGFMILFENQYKLKDVVKIGDHEGQVEQITLRMTALRDDEGALHFMPNGSTTSVVNMTHGWSRAAFTVRVPLGDDVDRVIAAIQELGKEIRQDPALRLMIVDDLKMLGVDEINETVVVLKFYIKTLPLQQWNVKREFLRRLKKKLDQMHGAPPAG